MCYKTKATKTYKSSTKISWRRHCRFATNSMLLTIIKWTNMCVNWNLDFISWWTITLMNILLLCYRNWYFLDKIVLQKTRRRTSYFLHIPQSIQCSVHRTFTARNNSFRNARWVFLHQNLVSLIIFYIIGSLCVSSKNGTAISNPVLHRDCRSMTGSTTANGMNMTNFKYINMTLKSSL